MRFAALFIAAFLIALPALASQENTNELRFTEEQWNKTLLKIIDQGPEYLSREDQYTGLKPFPANDSEETKKELKYLHSLIPERNDKTIISKIQYENSGMPVREAFAKEGFLADGNHETEMLIDILDKDVSYFVLASKKEFARPRPSHLDPSLDTVIENPAHASYPSGHATQAHIVALVLADFDPANAQRYKKFAFDIAHRREIAGIHFPSDTKAGIEFAEHVYNTFRSIPAFEKKYQDAKLTYIKPNLQKEEDLK